MTRVRWLRVAVLALIAIVAGGGAVAVFTRPAKQASPSPEPPTPVFELTGTPAPFPTAEIVTPEPTVEATPEVTAAARVSAKPVRTTARPRVTAAPTARPPTPQPTDPFADMPGGGTIGACPGCPDR